ncbi:nitroreductase family deazaflavin-dependent oxidoreductase [bacterium]|nr:nitroreductase family deazaflavin-dependent oxidoreductase [bacterium]
MPSTTPEIEQSLRQVFKYFNKFMLLMWRLGLGSWVNGWPSVGGRIMVLVHTGRKSGRHRQTPVNYAIVDGELYCTSGFGGISDWYRNIRATPNVEVWLPEGWWQGVAEEIENSEQRLPLLRQLLMSSGAVAQGLGVDPIKTNDADLDAITCDYKVIHIRRTAARTGPDGPGDLAWIWPLATFVLLLLAMRRKK